MRLSYWSCSLIVSSGWVLGPPDFARDFHNFLTFGSLEVKELFSVQLVNVKLLLKFVSNDPSSVRAECDAGKDILV
jgi:hypothetical protein